MTQSSHRQAKRVLGEPHFRMYQLSVVQVFSPGTKACLFWQVGCQPQLIQLVLYAQPHRPPAEGAVKGVGDVQDHLHDMVQVKSNGAAWLESCSERTESASSAAAQRQISGNRCQLRCNVLCKRWVMRVHQAVSDFSQ